MLSSLYIYTQIMHKHNHTHVCSHAASHVYPHICIQTHTHTDTQTHTHTHTSCETAKNKKDAAGMFKIAFFFLDTPHREVGG